MYLPKKYFIRGSSPALGLNTSWRPQCRAKCYSYTLPRSAGFSPQHAEASARLVNVTVLQLHFAPVPPPNRGLPNTPSIHQSINPFLSNTRITRRLPFPPLRGPHAPIPKCYSYTLPPVPPRTRSSRNVTVTLRPGDPRTADFNRLTVGTDAARFGTLPWPFGTDVLRFGTFATVRITRVYRAWDGWDGCTPPEAPLPIMPS